MFINHEYIRDDFPSYLGNGAISASDIKNFYHSPKYFYYKKYEEKPEDKPNGRHFAVGSAFHHLVTEPNTFSEYFFGLKQKYDKRTKDGKNEYAAVILEHGEKKVCLEKDEYDLIQELAKSAQQNKTLMTLLENSYRELSIYATDSETGLKVKCRPDIMCQEKPTIVDLKSANSGSYREFRKAVYSFGYNISAPWYCDITSKRNYVFAACEKEPPYPTALYMLSEDMMRQGRRAYRMCLDCLAYCQKENVWPEYNSWKLMRDLYELGNLEAYKESVNEYDGIEVII